VPRLRGGRRGSKGASPWRPRLACEEEEGRAPHLSVRAPPARRKKGQVPHLGVRAPPVRRKKGRVPHLASVLGLRGGRRGGRLTLAF